MEVCECEMWQNVNILMVHTNISIEKGDSTLSLSLLSFPLSILCFGAIKGTGSGIHP